VLILIPDFIRIHSIVLEVKHADKWTDMTSSVPIMYSFHTLHAKNTQKLKTKPYEAVTLPVTYRGVKPGFSF